MHHLYNSKKTCKTNGLANADDLHSICILSAFGWELQKRGGISFCITLVLLWGICIPRTHLHSRPPACSAGSPRG
jgi:hypothetical protein